MAYAYIYYYYCTLYIYIYTFFLVLVEALHVRGVCALVVSVTGAEGGGEQRLDEWEDYDLESYVYIVYKSIVYIVCKIECIYKI